jgi:hypothetical protein
VVMAEVQLRKQKLGWGVAQVVECLPRKRKLLNAIPSIPLTSHLPREKESIDALLRGAMWEARTERSICSKAMDVTGCI